jgi:hypothetical protein
LKNLSDQALRLIWLFQEQLDDCRKDLELGLQKVSSVTSNLTLRVYLCKLFSKRIHEVAKNLSSVVDLLGVLSNDPNQGRPCIGLVQFVDALA